MARPARGKRARRPPRAPVLAQYCTTRSNRRRPQEPRMETACHTTPASPTPEAHVQKSLLAAVSRVLRNSVESAPMRRCVSATLRRRNESGWAGGLALTVHTPAVICETKHRQTSTSGDVPGGGAEASRIGGAALDAGAPPARRFAFDSTPAFHRGAGTPAAAVRRVGLEAESISRVRCHGKPALSRRFAARTPAF